MKNTGPVVKPIGRDADQEHPLGGTAGNPERDAAETRRVGANALDAIADMVLRHKPKPKSKPARKRARRAKKIAQAADA